MAAHLDLIHLRWHALPTRLMVGADRPTDQFRKSAKLPVVTARPRLSATWHIGCGGRPVCAWSIDTDDPA